MLMVARLIGILLVIVAAVAVSLGIFGVFSAEEIKNSLQKIIEVAIVVLLASGVIALLNKPNK